MSADLQSAREDLAFLRGLVDDDYRPGLWGFGATYVSIGVVLCLHMLLSWAGDAGGLPVRPLAAYAVLYGMFSAIWLWISRKARAHGFPPRSVKSRAGQAAAGGALLAHLVMLGVLVIVAVRQQSGFVLELAPLVLFATQGVVWLVVHAMRPRGWHLAEAAGWFAATLALAPLVGTDVFGPALAAVAVVLMIVPGAYMIHLSGKAA